MAEPSELVTVYRSADPSAQEDAEAIRDLLADAGLAPVLLGDDAPGVPSGAYEVRVAADEAARAEDIIAALPAPEPEVVDPSHDLDLETIFDAIGANAEVEALAVKGVLDANEIPSTWVGAPQYPNLRFLIRVPKLHAARAREVLDEAKAAGPAAAEQAEMESEQESEGFRPVE